MPDFVQALQGGATHLWLFIPAAILLGALHGLEPGHSKTMMAAFIVAIRGTIGQAVLLGVSAAISHSLIIWVLVAAVLYYGSQWGAEQAEPYIQFGSAVATLLLAFWMYVRTRRDLRQAAEHLHDHPHPHREHGHAHAHGHPHPGHQHVRRHHAHHGHLLEGYVLDLGHTPGSPDREFQDAHEREHAQDILQRFGGRPVTTPQIVLFGITGGLMPCPAAFTVLLVCLQLKRVALGFVMVGAFSFGLALTMVATGALAAWSVQHAQQRFRGFGELMRRAPYVSCVLLVLLAAYMAWQGWHALPQ